ncbi:MAG: TlpA disulfide reductase family protein [Thermoanaerobaculia bacterium]
MPLESHTGDLRSRLRRGIFALLLGFLAQSLPAWAAGEPPGLVTLEGAEIPAAELAQGRVVLVVWASWSPRCRDIADRLNALNQQWGREAKIYAVSFQEDRAAVDAFLAGRRLPVQAALDREGNFSKRHAITALPSLIVFEDGRSLYSGKLPDDANGLLANLLK